ncbi:MAG: hypothetical protein JWL95_947 [Gemmatimonadetes bacterium]|nr:hypothetical protein [Gemmatimonadota bacterium]
MLTHLPLDDELNHPFYVDGGIWRLVWANTLGICVLRREQVSVDFDDAIAMIARGELLWAPPDRFERLATNTPLDAVQREQILLNAFLRSPSGQRITKWRIRRRLELRVADAQSWLANRALTRGDADRAGDA